MTQPRVRLSQMKRDFIRDLKLRIEASHVISAYEAAMLLQAIDETFNPKTRTTKIEKDHSND